jgi:hypothetical protein
MWRFAGGMTLSVAQAEAVLKQHLSDAERASLLPKQVTICGGGNGAHVCAGYLGWKGIKVRKQIDIGVTCASIIFLPAVGE